MMVIKRKKDQSIDIGKDVQVKVLKIIGNTVVLGVTAPRDTPVHRREVTLKIQSQHPTEI